MNITELMPWENVGWTLAQYIDLALQLCGSSFTVGEVEEDPHLKIFLEGGYTAEAPSAAERGHCIPHHQPSPSCSLDLPENGEDWCPVWTIHR